MAVASLTVRRALVITQFEDGTFDVMHGGKTKTVVNIKDLITLVRTYLKEEE